MFKIIYFFLFLVSITTFAIDKNNIKILKSNKNFQIIQDKLYCYMVLKPVILHHTGQQNLIISFIDSNTFTYSLFSEKKLLSNQIINIYGKTKTFVLYPQYTSFAYTLNANQDELLTAELLNSYIINIKINYNNNYYHLHYLKQNLEYMNLNCIQKNQNEFY